MPSWCPAKASVSVLLTAKTPTRRTGAPGAVVQTFNAEYRNLGFTKLVKRDEGVYENVTAVEGEKRYMRSDDPDSVPHIHRKVKDCRGARRSASRARGVGSIAVPAYRDQHDPDPTRDMMAERAMDAASNDDLSADEVQQELIDEFGFFDNWTDRYQYLIDLGRKLPPFPEQWRTEDHLLHGCQSQVWIHRERRDGLLHFDAISDSAIVSGLIALLLRVYSDRRADEILATEPAFIRSIGLDSHLSPTRKNGLHSMLQAIRAVARADASTPERP